MITAMPKQSTELDLFPDGEISIKSADERRPRRQDIKYIAGAFARTSLPYKQPPPNTMEWTRKNGSYTLTVQPGMDKDEHGNSVSIGFPSGTMPRLTSMWASDLAFRTKSRTLVLPSTMTEFFAEIGVKNASSGRKGMATEGKLQLERLFQASVSLRIGGTDKATGTTYRGGARINVADSYELWWAKDERGQGELLPSVVTLSENFYEMCLHPVPVDMNTVQKLRGSAMRIDQYWWLTHRMSYLEDQRGVLVPWDSLYLQFGSQVETSAAKNSFRKQFESNLNETLKVYDKASARVIPGKGVLLLPGATDIRPSQSRDLELLELEWRKQKALAAPQF